jgi:uncharacterized protein YoxC
MIEGNLDTTNLLLGILAAVSVLEALLLIAVGVMALKLYRQTMETVREIEQRQVAPLAAKVHALMGTVDGILVDVKGITSRLNQQTERVNSAITTTIDRVDETADRVRSSLGYRVHRVASLVQGMRAALGTFFNGHTRRTEAHP